MTDPHHVRLAASLQEREIDAHITVEQEDSVREDWWRAGCMVHDWYTTGNKDTVEGAAAMHVADEHLACSAPSDRTFIGVPLYCHLEPDHDGDEHANGGYTWPKKSAEPVAAEPLRCPLASCGLVLNDARPLADWMRLAQSLGMDIAPLRALDYLREHLETHTFIDFITEISRLRKLLEDEPGHIHIVMGPATKVVFNPLPADLDEA